MLYAIFCTSKFRRLSSFHMQQISGDRQCPPTAEELGIIITMGDECFIERFLKGGEWEYWGMRMRYPAEEGEIEV